MLLSARRLREAERNARQLRQFSLEFPEMTLEDGYRIQRAFRAARSPARRLPAAAILSTSITAC
jgi:2-oxo-hept-3-ene-1,7-dioate hydratase